MAVAPPREAVDLLTKPFYAPSEVAQLASLSNSTILNYIHDGRLAAVKLSERTYRIPRKAVIRLLGLDAPDTVVSERPDAMVEL
jgi:excisionase family DNA binding protein